MSTSREVIRQVGIAVVIAMLVGGSLPWWYDKVFNVTARAEEKRISRQVSLSYGPNAPEDCSSIYEVPRDRHLVIEHVEGQLYKQLAELKWRHAIVRTVHDGVEFLKRVSIHTDGKSSWIAEDTKLYADPGTTVGVCVAQDPLFRDGLPVCDHLASGIVRISGVVGTR